MTLLNQKVFIFLLFLISFSTSGQKRDVLLEESNEMSYVVYKNKTAIIKLSFIDLIGEIDKLKRTKWFLGADTSRQKRIDTIHSKLKREAQRDAKRSKPQSSMVTTLGTMWMVERTKYYAGDSLMITLIKRAIGSSLLIERKDFANAFKKMELAMESAHKVPADYAVWTEVNILIGDYTKAQQVLDYYVKEVHDGFESDDAKRLKGMMK